MLGTIRKQGLHPHRSLLQLFQALPQLIALEHPPGKLGVIRFQATLSRQLRSSEIRGELSLAAQHLIALLQPIQHGIEPPAHRAAAGDFQGIGGLELHLAGNCHFPAYPVAAIVVQPG